jgi:vitamin B12 transporter
MHQCRQRAAAFCACLLFTASGFAGPAPKDIIIVTATRTEIPLDSAIVPVTVITREDIELSLATDLGELLRFEAGIDLGRNGGPGQAASVFLRGTESNHTLVLVDGVRINPGTLGGAAIQHISPEVIERVEIVKGARSALFGTDAIGGVINIITRRNEDSYLEGGLGTGSFDTRSGFLSGGSRGDRGEFGITLDWQDTGGYAPHVDSEIDRGYENFSANLYGSRRLGRTELGLRHWRTEGTVEYLDFFLQPLDQDFENSTTAFEVSSKLSREASSKLVVAFMEDNIVQNQSPDFVKSERLSLDWQYSRALASHIVTGGLFAIDETASTLSFGSGFAADTGVRAAFLQDQWTRGRHRSFLALRLTDHEAFGDHVTWNAEYAYDINDYWTLNAGLGHAFRAPDATDRYGFGGNPGLDPELADEAQLSLRFTPGLRHSIYLEAYRNDIRDLIEFNVATFELENISEAEIRGAQLGYEYRAGPFELRATVVRQSADNAVTGERLPRRAEETASLSLVREIGAHRVGIALYASGDREDFGGIELPGYVLANLTAQFQLHEDWSLNARIENLLDRRYETAADFRMQSRSAFLQLKYHWR